jgi:hypothetical protein
MAVEDLKQAEGAMRGQLDFVLAYEAKVNYTHAWQLPHLVTMVSICIGGS